MAFDGWVPYKIVPESFFFPIFQKVIKSVNPGQKSLKIAIINKERSKFLKMEVKEFFKFCFDWQCEDICGIEIFKQIGEENGKST